MSTCERKAAAPPAHTIHLIDSHDKEAFQECIHVRIQVFHHEQGFPLDTELDDLEDISIHLLLRVGDKPVGVIRGTFKSDHNRYKLSRLALLKEYRSYGWGGELVYALHDWVRSDAHKRGIADPEIICHSQIPAKGFYAKYGYRSEGPEFDEDGAPHQLMVTRVHTSQ